MRHRFMILSFAAGLAFAMPLVFAQQFSSVEERMSSSDFKAAGLDKLSPEELARLNAFIKNEIDQKTVQAREEGIKEQDRNDAAKIGFKDYNGDRDKIVSTIVGKFDGWSGGTTFTLENGQVWRQSDPAAQFSIHLESPTVHISPGIMGTWFLQIEGYGAYTKVERVR